VAARCRRFCRTKSFGCLLPAAASGEIKNLGLWRPGRRLLGRQQQHRFLFERRFLLLRLVRNLAKEVVHQRGFADTGVSHHENMARLILGPDAKIALLGSQTPYPVPPSRLPPIRNTQSVAADVPAKILGRHFSCALDGLAAKPFLLRLVIEVDGQTK
jgi:hypothetical protein